LKVYGVGIRKGGQGKSTTVSCLARLCAIYGARVLVVDLAQPGTTSSSLRDIWIPTEHGDLSSVLLAFRQVPAGSVPGPTQARDVLVSAGLPVAMTSQPSWSGGHISVLPWDEIQADAAAFLHSERVLAGLLAALASDFDVVLIDYPAESGPLLTNALAATANLLIPLTPEAPALEGVDAMLRLLARVRESGYEIELGGVLLTRSEPKNKRLHDIVQTILQADEVEGEALSRKLFPFAVRQVEFYEQAFRYGEPIWERTANPSHWAAYVLLAEWLLRDAGLLDQANARRGPALLPADTPILDTTALMLNDPEIPLVDFERAHAPFGR
jgi:chromosome partitioning protein